MVVRSARGQTLGHAFYSDRSQIALRMLTRGEEPADDGLIRRRIEAALAFRGTLAIDGTACRLVHGEADLLPSADRRSVRRLPGGADAVAGRRSPAAAGRLDAAGTGRARGDPREERSPDALAGGAGAEGRSAGGRRAGRDCRDRERRALRRRRPARPEDGPLPGSAREPQRRGPVCARPAAGLLHVQRRLRAGARGPVRGDDCDRRVRGRHRARQAERRRATA